MHQHPFKVFWMRVEPPLESPCQVLFSISRQGFRRAVDRNRIRRLMREAYRQHAHLLSPGIKEYPSTLVFAILYTGKTIPTYDEVSNKILIVLKRLSGDHEAALG